MMINRLMVGLALVLCACGSARVSHDPGTAPKVDLAAPSPDIAPAPDLIILPDLSEPAPDLTELPDLARSPDMTKPLDLAQGGNCLNGAPCPPNTVCCKMGIRAGTCYNPACLACCM